LMMTSSCLSVVAERPIGDLFVEIYLRQWFISARLDREIERYAKYSWLAAIL